MEVSTNNNNSTQQQQQQQPQTNNNNKNNDISASITTSHQSIIMSNDNLQSQSTKSSIILTELTTTTATTTVTATATDIKSNTGSSPNSNNHLDTNSEVTNSIATKTDIINTNGDTLLVSRQNNHEQLESNGTTAESKDMSNELIIKDVQSIIESILDRIPEVGSNKEQVDRIEKDEKEDNSATNDISDTANLSQSSLCIPAGHGSQTKTSLITPVAADEVDDDKTKDIVTLRNLEITPPPQPACQISELEMDETDEGPVANKQTKSRRDVKRPHSEASNGPSDDSSNSRSKRQRKQTELFQVETNLKPSRLSTSSEKSTASNKRRLSSSSNAQPKQKQPKKAKGHQRSTTQPQNQNPHQQQQLQINHDLQDVIFYEKNDYLAIRNEENTFYLCQLAENVRVQRPFIKVKWLDSKDDGKTYFLTSQYDNVPQKSIIMPVILNKLKSEKKGQQLFSLDDQHKDNIMDRLRRSLNVPTEGEQ